MWWTGPSGFTHDHHLYPGAGERTVYSNKLHSTPLHSTQPLSLALSPAQRPGTVTKAPAATRQALTVGTAIARLAAWSQPLSLESATQPGTKAPAATQALTVGTAIARLAAWSQPLRLSYRAPAR